MKFKLGDEVKLNLNCFPYSYGDIVDISYDSKHNVIGYWVEWTHEKNGFYKYGYCRKYELIKNYKQILKYII